MSEARDASSRERGLLACMSKKNLEGPNADVYCHLGVEVVREWDLDSEAWNLGLSGSPEQVRSPLQALSVMRTREFDIS